VETARSSCDPHTTVLLPAQTTVTTNAAAVLSKMLFAISSDSYFATIFLI
jgi:hypothetical protein